MTPNTYDDGSRPRPENDDRYAAYATDDGTVVIYDVNDHSAWIESTNAVPLAAIA